MPQLFDTTFDIWIPGDQHKSFVTRGMALDSNTLLFVSSEENCAFPDVQINDREYGASVVISLERPVRLAFRTRTRDAVAVWRPGSNEDSSRLPASWESPRVSTVLDGMALGALLGEQDEALAAWAATAGVARLATRVGLVEETADLLVSIEAGAHPGGPLVVEWRVGGRPFAETIAELVDTLVAMPTSMHEPDLDPVLCTWYFQHLRVDEQKLTSMIDVAADLGFRTVIIDDGWQTSETERGYGTAGDWHVDPTKITDPKSFVEAWHAAGIRLLWWVGTPFVGHRSHAYLTAEVISDDVELDAGVLDPRSAGNAGRLARDLKSLISSTGADGLKIDFLDRFSLTSDSGQIDEAALGLVGHVLSSLRADRPDLSVEIREPYFGPAISGLATMVRVGDCPMSASRNRKGIADLRLATRGVAVHADPVMWAMQDSAGRVAQHLQNAMFGVLQVSVDLAALSADHEAVLRFWLRFAREYRTVLLMSHFKPIRPDLNYPILEAQDGQTVVTGRYQPVLLEVPIDGWREWIVMNADASPVLVRGGSGEIVVVEICSAAGEVLFTFDAPLTGEFPVPLGGLMTISRKP